MKLTLPPDEIAMLLRRGQDMLKFGDIPAARVALRRAAEAGNPEAAFILASTFDPNVLREAGVIGFAPDLGQALSWYEKASALGSEKAKRSIERLRYAQDR
jgi:TPR repeat protein